MTNSAEKYISSLFLFLLFSSITTKKNPPSISRPISYLFAFYYIYTSPVYKLTFLYDWLIGALSGFYCKNSCAAILTAGNSLWTLKMWQTWRNHFIIVIIISKRHALKTKHLFDFNRSNNHYSLLALWIKNYVIYSEFVLWTMHINTA